MSEIGIRVRLDPDAIAALTARERAEETRAGHEPLLVDFRLPGERRWVHCRGRLVWHASIETPKSCTAGIEFTRVPVVSELALERFVGRFRPV